MTTNSKDERQYAGVEYDVAPSTPDDEMIDKYTDSAADANETPNKQTMTYYSLKLKAIDIAQDFLKLTAGPSPSDILITSSILLDYIVSKNEN